MINIKASDQNCCGCYACFNACPKKAIDMVFDNEGFTYPTINSSKCVHCDECSRVCPLLNQHEEASNSSVCYAAYCNNESIRKESSSGGLFSLLAQNILNKGGVVFGAVFDDKYEVVHYCATNENEISKIRGSKYLQSNIGQTYSDVKKYLDSGCLVMFTGTPCQIEGLLFYLKRDYENLFTQDIICHGVPSRKVWNLFLKSNHTEIINDLSFRDKTTGWEDYSLRINGYLESHKNNKFMKAFVNDLCLRPSCYVCKFKKRTKLSDITLGDLWGADFIAPELNDNNGLSFVEVNTQKGIKMFSEISNKIIYKSISFENALSYNPSLLFPNARPKNRDDFMNEINQNNFSKIVSRYCQKPFLKRVFFKD